MSSALASIARSRLLAYAIIALASLRLYAVTDGYALLGMDTYPVIASGLLRGPEDLVTIFTSPAVPGRVPYAFRGFYRPFVTLSLGIDYALFGLEPRGYFATQAVLFGASALALYELARRLLGAATFAPLLALATFLLAPSHVETLAVVARRSEPLCAIFGALALWVETRRIVRGKRLSWLAGAWTLLAVIAKTTGIALLPAVFVLTLVSLSRATLLARLRAAIVATVPHVVAVAVAFAVQIAILGEVGGHITSRASGGIDRLPWALERLAHFLILPQPALRASAITWLLLFAIALGVVATAVLILRRGRDEVARVAGPSFPTLAMAAVWLLGLASLYGAVGLLQGWYVFVPAMAYALLVGAVAAALVRAMRSATPTLRTAGAATLVALCAWTLWQGRYSMLVSRYTAVERASALTAQYVADLAQRVAAAPDGAVVVVPPPLQKLPPREGELVLDGPLLLAEYAFSSWAECAFPERRVVVHDRRKGEPVATPDAVTIVFRP